MENVRKGAQKAFFSNKRLHFKQNKYILLAPRETLGIEDGIVLEYMLKQNSDLYNAWQLKEIFYKFKDSASYDEAGEDKGVWELSERTVQLERVHTEFTQIQIHQCVHGGNEQQH